MFTSDTAIVQDLKASISFIRLSMSELEQGSSADAVAAVSALPEPVQRVYALGLRHSQRLIVDALIKAFVVIAKDIDNVQLKSFDAILDAMTLKTALRGPVLDTNSHRHVFVARMLANTAGLLVTPAPSLAESAYAAQASLRTVEPGVAALEVFLASIAIVSN